MLKDKCSAFMRLANSIGKFLTTIASGGLINNK
jgi:hypothetical protein